MKTPIKNLDNLAEAIFNNNDVKSGKMLIIQDKCDSKRICDGAKKLGIEFAIFLWGDFEPDVEGAKIHLFDKDFNLKKTVFLSYFALTSLVRS